MILGNFRFSIKTASQNSLKRSTDYRWIKIERAGELAYFQNLGMGSEKIEIAGICYPSFTNDYTTFNEIRKIAKEGKSHVLITDEGEIIGNFVILNIVETQSFFDSDGRARKIEFQMSLEKVEDKNFDFNIINSNLKNGLLRW